MSFLMKTEEGFVNIGGGGASSADKISYDNTSSGLESDNVQSAVDELTENKANKDEILPNYTLAEYEEIKDTIPVGTKFIITDDLDELDNYIPAPQTAEVGQILAVKSVDENNKISETECVDVYTKTQTDTAIQSKVTAPQIAEVGQVLAVKAIDENGKPTEWETVDGGGDGFNYPDEIAMMGDQLYVKEIDENGKPIAWSYTKPDPLAPIMDKDIAELTYDEIATIVRAGRAREKFKIGDQIVTKYTATDGAQYDMPFDVVAFREVELEDASKVPGMIIQSHYATVEDMQFDAAEPSSSDSNVKSYGWNRWMYSNIRQWLNSDKAKGLWWTSAHSYDAAPSNLSTVNGFMKGFSSDFINMLKPTKHETALNYVYPSGSETVYVYDTTYDTFFLPSAKEEHFKWTQYPNRYDGSDREGSTWEYWVSRKGETAQEYNTTNTNAIRYSLADKSTAKAVWLRSASRGYSYLEFRVNTAGLYYGSDSYYSICCSPACIIC